MKLLSACLVAVLISVIAFVGALQFGTAQSGTNVNGIINSDITWTQANSPYTLTGPAAIANGVTLTIDPGVTINLGSYYIIVNGTLQAKGTNTNQIHFIGGQIATLNMLPVYPITFETYSSGWNEQTGLGCIIENAIVNGTTILIDNASPKINNNSITGGIIIQEYSTGSPIISNNIIHGAIEAGSESPIIFNNIINNPPSSGLPTTGIEIGLGDSNAIVFNNTISDCYTGISESGENSIISNNIVSTCQIGIDVDLHNGGSLTVENNLISDNSMAGIQILGGSPLIKDNTITDSSVGIIVNYEDGVYVSGFTPIPTPSILSNNIYANSIYNFKSGISNNIDVASNWWGTIDPQAINQTIYDSKNDFNIGTVNFITFLTASNPQAMPDPNAPIPTPVPTSTPNQTSSSTPTPTSVSSQNPISIYEILIAILVVLIVAFVAVMAVLVRGKRR